MRRTIGTITSAIAALALLAACSSSGGTGGQSPSPSDSAMPSFAADLNQQLTEVMKANAIPGAEVLVRTRDQGDFRTILGTSELGKDVPMTGGDSFRVGSNTKTMTSTVILQLAQEGKLSLTDPISKFVDGVPKGDKITLTMLSEMRSGLFSYTFDKKFNETIDKEPQKAWQPEELLEIAFSHKSTAAPGTEYDYCNTNIVLLGLVIEKVTGMSARDAFAERIFTPLGLSKTFLPEATDSSLPDPHPQGYQFGTNVETIDSYAVPKDQVPAALDGTLKPLNYTDSNPSWAWTAGGAISTMDELATYVEAMVDGKLLDAEYQKIRLDSIQPLQPGAPVGYGLGIAQFTTNLYGHDGQLPGYSTFMARDAERGITIVLGTNLSASPVSGTNAAVVLAEVVIANLYGASAVPGGDPAGGAGAESGSPSASPASS